MGDGTKIRREREVTRKIGNGETEKQARRKFGIWQFVYIARVKWVAPKHYEEEKSKKNELAYWGKKIKKAAMKEGEKMFKKVCRK